MTEEIYRKLADALNERPHKLTAVPCEEFYAFARELFTPEQADIACGMPVEPVSLDELAAILTQVDANRLKNQLEEMARGGLVQVIESNGRRQYELIPFVPGFVEIQFTKGQSDERTKRLWELYLACADACAKACIVAKKEKKVIKVGKALDFRLRILPYQEAMRLIDTADHIAVGTCVCRHGGELIGDPCDKPKNDICMVLGQHAKAVASYGFVHLISKDEARRVLALAEDAGLVHQYTENKGSGCEWLCNCCGCHCMGLKPIISHAMPSQKAMCDWIAMIEDETCVGCEACIGRCWTSALKMEDSLAVRDANRCIGCGLCVSVCPTDAIKLMNR